LFLISKIIIVLTKIKKKKSYTPSVSVRASLEKKKKSEPGGRFRLLSVIPSSILTLRTRSERKERYSKIQSEFERRGQKERATLTYRSFFL
jgi:hypothetical protein